MSVSTDIATEIAIVGGGLFGVRLALTLSERGRQVCIVERGPEICGRASYVNQARVHNGYHYPRSLATARGSHANYDRFRREFADCIVDRFQHLYAIAAGSFTSAYQFTKFCEFLSLPLHPTPAHLMALFDRSRIEESFLVDEVAFDARAVRAKYARRIGEAPSIRLLTGTRCERVELGGERALVHTDAGVVEADAVFIAAYSGINEILHDSGLEPLDLKAEVAEICIVEPPPALQGVGLTVMDGPFFSCMPMPAEQAHSLTHVRYTPSLSWSLRASPSDPGAPLAQARGGTRFSYMRNDARRFVPAMNDVAHLRSLFEIKAIPNKHEVDDGRPIVLKRHSAKPLCVSVLGSKLDSVFELDDAVVDIVGSSGL